MPRVDWGRWETEYTENLAKYRSQMVERPSFEELTPEKITNLEDEEFDAFVAYLKVTIGKNSKPIHHNALNWSLRNLSLHTRQPTMP